MMLFRVILPMAFGLLISGLTACGSLQNLGDIDNTRKTPEDKARILVETARDTLVSLAEDQQIGETFLEHFRAKNVVGIVITPNLVKGGFFLGGSGGSGVLLAKAANGEWSYPAFVRQGSGSFGLQVGFQSAKVASIITSSDQLEVMLKGSPVAGGEAGGAVVNEGAGVDYSSGLDVSAALKSYAVARGAYVGVNVKLGGLWADAELNSTFYGDPAATPQSIVLEARQHNAIADPLRNTLMQYYSGF